MKIDYTEVTVKLMEEYTAKYLQENAELVQDTIKATLEAINYSTCCTQLKACFQIGEKVILDNQMEVEVLVAEPKLYIRQNEYDGEMWVSMKRLKKKSL